MDVAINKEQIETIGNRIIELSEQLGNAIQQYCQVIEEVKIAWDGQAATSYISAVQDNNIPSLEELREILVDYGTYFKHVPGAYQVIDEVFANKPIEE